jgi:hypothetical protein
MPAQQRLDSGHRSEAQAADGKDDGAVVSTRGVPQVVRECMR